MDKKTESSSTSDHKGKEHKNSSTQHSNGSITDKGNTVPDKARDIAEQIQKNNGTPPKGYKGGRIYKNMPLEDGAQKLPNGTIYREYDVSPYVKGQNRGAELIVIGDDGSAWYTNNHYRTFTRIK